MGGTFSSFEYRGALLSDILNYDKYQWCGAVTTHGCVLCACGVLGVREIFYFIFCCRCWCEDRIHLNMIDGYLRVVFYLYINWHKVNGL